MRRLEFRAEIGADHTLALPSEIAMEIEAGEQVRVILVVPNGADDAEWAGVTAEQFLAGYADGDAIYDALPPR